MDEPMNRDMEREIVENAAKVLNGEFNITRNGAARFILILPVSGIKVSIVFLPSTGQWKIFKPFPAVDQERIYFRDFKELKAYVETN